MSKFVVIECQGIGKIFSNGAILVEAITPEDAVFTVTKFSGTMVSEIWGDPAAKTWLVRDTGKADICCFVVEVG